MKTRILLGFLTLGSLFLSGCSSEPPAASGSVPDEASAPPRQVDQLVLINRMLASEEFGVLGAYGHVSVRKEGDAARLEGNPVAGNPTEFEHGSVRRELPEGGR